MSHPSRDDLTAYALGALEPAEHRSVAEHSEGCERCERELRALAPAVGVLAESVEQREPPPELRERLMEVIRSEAADAEPARAERRARRRRGRGLGGFLLRPAAGLAVVALAIAAVAGYLVAGDGGDDARTVPVASTLPGAGGSLVVQGDQATLSVHGVPPPAEGVLQIWVTDGATTRPAGTLAPSADGAADAAVPQAASGADMVLVTREPRAGMSAPTSDPVLEVELN
jgi:anti-sigma factor RsiW